jgi:MFS family permease
MPTQAESSASRRVWVLSLSAAAILMVTMGVRQTSGLFVSPINTATGLGIVSISFALAIGQFVWGATQPIFGAIADKFGPVKVIIAGTVMLAIGTALTPFMSTEWGLILTLGILSAGGAGAGSFSILIGATARMLPAERRSFAAGFINAGGSFGQFLFAPIVQAIIASAGWVSAMLALAVASLASIPLVLPFANKRAGKTSGDASVGQVGATAAAASTATTATTAATAATAAVPAELGLKQQVRVALRDHSYLYLHAGFFTCGFHIAFLVTHLPGEVALCNLSAGVSATALAIIGLFNIAGSILAGIFGNHYRMKNMLALIYASRAAIIVLYLLAPKTPLTFYIFAAALGITWLSTVAPTAGIVGKLFGTRYLATLFGLTLLSHQIGGFFGAWLGGITFASHGNYQWMWYADIALALLAAVVNLPIKEAAVVRRPAAKTVPA